MVKTMRARKMSPAKMKPAKAKATRIKTRDITKDTKNKFKVNKPYY